jgi:hypothetical protein
VSKPGEWVTLNFVAEIVECPSRLVFLCNHGNRVQERSNKACSRRGIEDAADDGEYMVPAPSKAIEVYQGYIENV